MSDSNAIDSAPAAGGNHKEDNPLLAAALSYARRGWAVFPLRPRDKVPLISKKEGGTGFRDATCDQAKIRDWWARCPEANIGLATGSASGVDVLDIDERNGGLSSAEAIKQRHGGIPHTVASRTGNGYHYFFQHTEGTRCSASRLGPGLDTRSDGGYVVAPPSVHPNGRCYEWLEGHGPVEVAVTPPPPWLLASSREDGGDVPQERVTELERLAADAPVVRDLDEMPEIQAERWAEIKLLVITGQRAIADNDAPRTDKNAILLDAACQLVRAGVDDRRIAGVLKNDQFFQHPELGNLHHVFKPEHRTDAQRWRAVARCIAKAREEVAREQPPNEAPPWDRVNKNGEPVSSYNNARSAILRLGITCEHDSFKDRYVIGGHAVQEWQGELSDNALAMLRQLILETFGFDPGKEHTRDAAIQLCVANARHPIRQYLDGLHWDGMPRVANWLTTYLGSDETALNSAIGKIVLLAAVRRVRQPGCKFDSVPFLIGEQGGGKSSAVEIMAGEKNFSDEDLISVTAKERAELTQGVWIFEIGDLQGWSNSDVNKMKAYASRREDRCRPAYGRARVDRPRQFIMVASTNEEHFLRDLTGNRRYLPIRIGKIDLAALRRDRDQLWAEAAALEAAGESITLGEELWRDAAALQEQHMEEDDWVELLQQVKGEIFRDEDGAKVERIRSVTIMVDHLKMDGAAALKQGRSIGKRLGRVMRTLGWDGPKALRFGAAGDVAKGFERLARSWGCTCCDGPFGDDVKAYLKWYRVTHEGERQGRMPL